MHLNYANPLLISAFSQRHSSVMSCRDLFHQERSPFNYNFTYILTREIATRLTICVSYFSFNLFSSDITLFRLHPFKQSMRTLFCDSCGLTSDECLTQIYDYLLSLCCFPLIESTICWTICINKATVFLYAMLFMILAHRSGQSTPNESINKLVQYHLVDILLLI